MADLQDHETCMLIELYRGQENLYNTSLKVYHDRDKSRESLQYIANAMGKGWTDQTTKMKLKSLRNGYTRILHQLEASKKSGASTDDVYKVKWKWYCLLDAFLRPHCRVVMKGVSNLATVEVEDTQSTVIQVNDAESSRPILPPVDNAAANWSSSMGCEADIEMLCQATSKTSPQAAVSTSETPSSAKSNYLSINEQDTAPNFVRFEPTRKRKAKTENSTKALNILQDMAGKLQDNMNKHTETKPKTKHQLYCDYLASQFEELNQVNQIKLRRYIDEKLFELQMEQEED